MSDAPHPFSLRQAQYFVAVAETLSFRQAAQRCHVAQPSLSSQIAQLEDVLGVRLLERDSKRVLLTRAGRELLPRARQLLRAGDDLLTAARGLADPLAGPLAIGVIPTVSPYLLPVVTPAVGAELPRLTLTWVEEKTPVLLERLGDGSLEAAVLALDASVGHLASAHLLRDELLCAVPRQHPLARGKRAVPMATLEQENVLLLEDGHCLRDRALEICRTAGARELGFRATSMATLVQMVASGRGITLLPRLALATELAHANVVVRPFARPAPHRELGLVWRKASPSTQALLALAESMRGALGQRRSTPTR